MLELSTGKRSVIFRIMGIVTFSFSIGLTYCYHSFQHAPSYLDNFLSAGGAFFFFGAYLLSVSHLELD